MSSPTAFVATSAQVMPCWLAPRSRWPWLLNVGNLAGRLGAGPLSGRIGRRAALHGNSALLVLACLPLATGASGALALVALLLLGLQ
jgi:hypothetical protein